MAKPEKFVFVCTNQRPPGHPRSSCTERGGRDILMRFAEQLEEKGLFGKVSLVNAGCLGPCLDGPVVAVFPDNIWYKKLTSADVDEIVSKHLVGGEVVTSLEFTDDQWG